MASTRNDPSALTALPSADNPADTPPSPSRVEFLLEELSIQQAVLASLRDLPESSSSKQEITAVEAGITDLRRQLDRAKRKGSYLRPSPACSLPTAAAEFC